MQPAQNTGLAQQDGALGNLNCLPGWQQEPPAWMVGATLILLHM